MTLREQLAAVPRWRVGLYAFAAGAASAAVAALALAAHGLVSPPVERELVVRTVTRERTVAKTAKRANVTTTVTSTPGLLRVPDGGVLLAYTTTATTRDLSTEDSATTRDASTLTQQRMQERSVLPSWRLGVQVGGQFVGKPSLALPQAPGLVFGVEASYRVPLDRLGLPPRYGVWVGAWGGTYGAAGASVSGEF